MAWALTRLPPETLESGFNGGLQRHVQASPAFVYADKAKPLRNFNMGRVRLYHCHPCILYDSKTHITSLAATSGADSFIDLLLHGPKVEGGRLLHRQERDGRWNRRWHSISPPRCAGHATHSMPPDLLGEEKLQLEAQLPVCRELGPLHVVEGLELGIDR
jgi:hypothetical protein